MDVTDLRPDAFARPPDWRWEKARLMIEDPRVATLLRKGDDDWVRKAKKFREAHARVQDDVDRVLLFNRWPNLVEAYKLRHDPAYKLQRFEVEARLLAGDDVERIQVRVKTAPAVTTWYERVFFNVTDRLANPGYISHAIIGESAQVGLTAREYDVLWKMLGYCGGGYVLDAFIDHHYDVTRPRNSGQVGQFIGDDVKRKSAMNMVIATRTSPINTYTAERISEVYMGFKQLEKMADAGGTGDMLGANVQAMIQVIGWAVGNRKTFVAADDPGRIVGRLRTEVAAADEAAAELRASDLIRLQAGDPGRLKALAAVRFPEKPDAAAA